MTQQIVIGNITKGLVQNRTAFNIDNDAFPQLYNAYSWRGRVKRKRGTTLLGRLQRQLSVSSTLSSGSITLTAPIALGSINLTVGGNVYTEPNPPDGTLVGTPSGTGTVNYLTGVITITGGGGSAITGTYAYYPDLPVMGLRDFLAFSPAQSAYNPNSVYPLLLAFDTTYSYQINQSVTPNFFYSTSFYQTGNPVVWTGADYEQFWTTNYNGALWATNGNPGFQFEPIATITVGSPTIITTTLAHGLKTGDTVFFYEVTGTDAATLNGQSAIVTVTGAMSFTVPINTTAKSINNSGIFQTLTLKSPTSSGDGIRWYNGDPTMGTGIFANTGLGWVNFSPPLCASGLAVSINNTPAAQYYLVGATAIVPFKDRLLFFGPSIQTSSGSPVYLPDTVIYSWNGTPYYSAPTPADETSDAQAYFVNQTGFGGWIAAGLSQEIISISPNEDVLIVGFTQRQTRFAYTSDDILPFAFFSINSEQYGSISTFSSINFDRGVVSIGQRGIVLTSQIDTRRIDLVIPEEVFGISQANNGTDRVSAVRDYDNEWIYFTYPSSSSPWKFPSQTFMYNYRDETWAVLEENYTAHGAFRALSSNAFTWQTVPYSSWEAWSEPWIAGLGASEYPDVIGGNQQGFVMIQDDQTGEGPSGYVTSITQISALVYQIGSVNHCLQGDDYVMLLNLLGITVGPSGLIGSVQLIYSGGTPDPNNFQVVYTTITTLTGDYIGGGTFTRFVVPIIQTKQFNTFWGEGRQCRLGPQRYLFDATANGQVTVNINLSQDSDTVWNYVPNPLLVPPDPDNTSIEYSQIVYTCPEGTNLGLTPANVNLQQLVAIGGGNPQQIWHRMNTSLQGDTVQLTITLSDAQMRNVDSVTSEIALHAIHLSVGKGPMLA